MDIEHFYCPEKIRNAYSVAKKSEILCPVAKNSAAEKKFGLFERLIFYSFFQNGLTVLNHFTLVHFFTRPFLSSATEILTSWQYW
jgi:hypothetical protein